MPPAECRPPEALAEVLVPLAGPADDNGRPPTGSVGCSPDAPATPAFPTLEGKLMFPGQASIGPPSGGATADSRIPTVPRPSCPATVCAPVDGLDTRRDQAHVPDLSREGLFDIYRDRRQSEATPRLCQDSQGCPFRITSYDLEIDGSDFSPELWCTTPRPTLTGVCGRPRVGTSAEPESGILDSAHGEREDPLGRVAATT